MVSVKRFSLCPASLFCVSVVTFAFVEPHVTFENEVILLLCNTLFTGLIPMAFSVIAARTYLKLKTTGALLMCCGLLVFSLGSLITGVLRFTSESANVSITVYNVCAFISSIFCLFTAICEPDSEIQKSHDKHNKLILLTTLTGLLLLVSFLIYGAIKSLWPPFIDDNGFTTLRYGVLFSAIGLFFAASMFYTKQYQKLKNGYHYWFALALFMVSVGLLGACIAKSVGSILGWVGRSSQYLGMLFALFSIIEMYRKSVLNKTNMTDVLAEFFSEPRRQKELLKTVLENMNDGIAIFDGKRNGILRNAAALKMYPNIKTDTSINNIYDTYACYDMEDRLIPTENLPTMRVFSGETIKNEKIKITYLLSETIRYVEVNAVPLYDQANNLISAVVTHHDITPSIEYEQSLKKQNDLLQKADHHKNEFLNALSHELRNPLAAIVTGTAFMSMLETSPKTREIVDIIDRQAKHLSRLVDDLVDVTRITNNKIHLKKERVELNALAKAVFQDYELLFRENGVGLEYVAPDTPVFTDADPTRITQIIGNLLYNSLKFTDKGGTALMSLLHQEELVCITVEDNGEGIDPEFLPDLFEPFKQADKSLGRSNGGLGLGLSIVKGIAELHGGTVTASSAGLGLGSTFTICLPKVDFIDTYFMIEGIQPHGTESFTH